MSKVLSSMTFADSYGVSEGPQHRISPSRLLGLIILVLGLQQGHHASARMTKSNKKDHSKHVRAPNEALISASRCPPSPGSC